MRQDEIRDIIKESHDHLDALNGKYGAELKLCLYCFSREYDTSGIIHKPNCLIVRMRKALSELPKS